MYCCDQTEPSLDRSVPVDGGLLAQGGEVVETRGGQCRAGERFHESSDSAVCSIKNASCRRCCYDVRQSSSLLRRKYSQSNS